MNKTHVFFGSFGEAIHIIRKQLLHVIDLKNLIFFSVFFLFQMTKPYENFNFVWKKMFKYLNLKNHPRKEASFCICFFSRSSIESINDD